MPARSSAHPSLRQIGAHAPEQRSLAGSLGELNTLLNRCWRPTSVLWPGKSHNNRSKQKKNRARDRDAHQDANNPPGYPPRHPDTLPKAIVLHVPSPRVKFDHLRITATIYNNYHLLLVKGCHSHMQGRYLLRKHYSRRKARVVGLNKIAKHGNSGREIYEYPCREDICWVSITAEGR